jgi:HEAT repeat protein
VRVAYLSAVETAPDSIRLASARAALATGDPQLTKEAASVLGGVRNKDAVRQLIALLDDPSSGAMAADGLFYLLARGFASSAEADRWWNAEEGLYDDRLQLRQNR